MLKQYLAVAVALVTLIGCRKEPSGGALPEGVCAVRFYGGGRAEVVPERSKSTAPMAQGTTVGVLAYQRPGSAAADVTADNFKAMKTYAAGSGGALTPSLTDDSGGVVAGNADGMELHNGTYDFYAYSPARKIETDHYTVKGIGHGTDFMAAVVPARTVSRSASDVELVFEHKCSKVRFEVKTAADMENASLAADSVILYKMAVSPAADYILGGDIVPSLGSVADTCRLDRVEAAADGKSTSVLEVLLPKQSGVFDGNFFLRINSRRYVLNAGEIPAMSFGKGVQYIFTAVVRQGSVDLVLNVASWDAVSGSVNAGEGGQTGSGSWDDGGGETGGNAGTNHGLVIGSWDNIDWNGGMGGNPDSVTGAVEVGSWKPAQVIVDAGGNSVADIDSWVKKTLVAQAGESHGGAVDGWANQDMESGMGEGTQGVQANCAIVKPGGTVVFDVVDRLVRTASAPGNSALHIDFVNTGWKSLLIWSDVSNIVKSMAYDANTGLLTVVTDGAKGSGNAVVGLFPAGTTDPAAGTCVWSWHLWVTDYNPDAIAKAHAIDIQNKAYTASGVMGQLHTYGSAYWAKNPNKAIMDRNLGATKALYALATTNSANYPTYGLFYQWGRKDPFPKAPSGTVANGTVGQQVTYNASGATTGYPTCTAGPVTVLKAIQNPHVFYYNASGTYDWNSSQNNALWGAGTIKSVYDPCPKGWRVAPSGTWDDFGTTWSSPFVKNSGWTAANADIAGGLYSAGSVKAFYPAPGYRHPYTGRLYDVGNMGYSWGGGGLFLLFGSQAIKLNSANCRAYGFQVRCIQE